LQNYHLNWHSICLQFTINVFFATLQLRLAFKLPTTCNPLLLPPNSTGIRIACNLQYVALFYNFNWHSNCVWITMNLLFATLQLQLAFKLPTTCNPLLLPLTSTGIQIACNLQWTCSLQNYFNWHSNCLQLTIHCSCLQLQLAYQLPATCNLLLFAYNYYWYSNACNLQFVCSLPTTTTGVQIAHKFAICLLFAYNLHFATRFLDLHLLRAQCLQKVNSYILRSYANPLMPPTASCLQDMP